MLRLVYEAFEPMALAEMKKLSAGARGQFEIAHVGIVHRLGKLEIGETDTVNEMIQKSQTSDKQ